MATELGETMYSGDALPAAKAAVLLVIGEPVSNGHKDLILGEISKGFQSWDVAGTGVDINEELASIANGASAGEEGPEGERVIRRSSEEVQVEILINPQASTVKMGLKAFLTTSTQHKHFVYAGHGFQGSGAWVLQDDIFTFTKFVQVFRDPDVENALKQQQGGTLSIHCFADGEWSNNSFAKQDFGKILKVSVNPEGKLSDMNGVLRFVTYVSNFVEGRSLNKLLQASDVVGNIRFSKPTLYVFPGCQGDSALFGISGFNLLINGGYNRKACFWDFTRHLDRIDAMLLTHLGPDNLFGIGSVLERKAVENVHPEIGYVYLNAGEKSSKHSPNGDLAPEEGGLLKASTLKVNLAEECSRLIEYCKQIGQAPHPCTRPAKGDTLEPINLYHKVGHGSLDMYVLNPIQDSKEIKEYFQQFSKHVGQFGLSQGLPLQDVLSTCALLVWKPSNPKENITRILFPGNAPQNKVIEGLEKVKNLDFLKHAKCCDKDLHAKPGKKGSLSSKAGRPISAKPPSASLRKEKVEKVEKPKVASSLKANKGVKEDTNKKAVKEKKEKQKPAKSATTNGTPASSSTPSGTPGRDVSPPSEVGVLPIPVMEANLIDVQPSDPTITDEQASAGGSSVTEDSKAEAEQSFQAQSEKPAVQGLPLEAPVDGDLDSPEPLPDPAAYQPDTMLIPEKAEETMAMVDEQVAMSKKTMEDLGIYDEDAEFPEDVPVQQEAAIVNNLQNNFEKAEDEEPEEDIGAFENDNPEAEEIQPEALPEPIAVPAYYDSERSEISQQPSEPPALPCFEESVKSESLHQQQTETTSFETSPADQEIVQQEVEDQEEAMFESELLPQSSAAQSDMFTTETPDVDDSVTPVDTEFTEAKVEDTSMEREYSQEVENTEEVLSNQAENFGKVYNQAAEVDEFVEDEREPVKSDNLIAEGEIVREEENTQESELNSESVNMLEDEMAREEPDVQAVDSNVEALDERAREVEGANDEIESKAVKDDQIVETVEAVKQEEFHVEDEMVTEEECMKEDETVREEDEAAKEDESLKEEDILEEEEEVGFENEYDDGEAIEQTTSAEISHSASEAPGAEQNQTQLTDNVSVAATDIGSSLFDAEDQKSADREPEGLSEEGFIMDDGVTVKQSDTLDDGDHAESSIPAAFEKDETPTRAEILSSQEAHPQEDTALYPDAYEAVDPVISDDLPKNFQQKHETDSLDGDPDDEKDVDEACVPGGLQEPPAVFPSNGNMPLSENPFAMNDHQIPDNAAAASPEMDQGGMNPFFGIDESNKQMTISGENPFTDNLNQDAPHQPFNPLKEWGEPMGLPSPMMEDAASNKPAQDKPSKPKPTKTLKNGSLKTADEKTAKKTETKKSPSKTQSLSEKRSPSGPSRTRQLVNGDSKPAKSLISERKTTPRTANSLEKKTTRTPRPATAPARTESKKVTDNTDVTRDAKTKPIRRPATASGNRASTPSIKSMPLPALTPFYVDLTYIPAHGDPNYSDVELFRRVRARYYVLSALSPTSQTLNSLMEAKKTWDDSNLEVTVIPTYDNETLRHWMGLHKDELNDLKIDVAPAASRCTIQLQDHETSCSAYRLEF